MVMPISESSFDPDHTHRHFLSLCPSQLLHLLELSVWAQQNGHQGVYARLDAAETRALLRGIIAAHHDSNRWELSSTQLDENSSAESWYVLARKMCSCNYSNAHTFRFSQKTVRHVWCTGQLASVIQRGEDSFAAIARWKASTAQLYRLVLRSNSLVALAALVQLMYT